jgi:hypothetical protein
MILTPYDTSSTLNKSTFKTETDLYYHVPENHNWEVDLADTIKSLETYFQSTDYLVIDSGQLANEKDVYITYLKGSVPPAIIKPATSQENPVVQTVENAITDLGVFLNGGNLAGNGLSDFLSNAGNKIIIVLFLVLIIWLFVRK